MKKIYALGICAMLALPTMAQEPQLPNSGFENEWGDCVPWTSGDNTKTFGTTPAPWTISQVIGINTLGATMVGEKAAGYESEAAAKVYNSPNSIIKTQTVPGYLTLGKTWSTAKGFAATNKDGGIFGGMAFTGRPEKITFMYKFERAEADRTAEHPQPANAIAYLWKGTYKQAGVPAEISLGVPKTVEMVNRDRNILGIATAEGGEITESGTLIAKGTTVITEETSEWVKGEIVFEYLTDDTPEMINVIFAAQDYFGDPAAIVQGNSLTVDNVYCVYPTAANGRQYKGSLIIDMAGSLLTPPEGNPATIVITPKSETACTFVLPDFTLEDFGNFGDIKLNEVSMITAADGVTTYSGHEPHLLLAGGDIDADVTLSGTSDASGNINMKIDVLFEGLPITCTFKGSLSGVESIVVDNANAPVEFYNLNGVRVDADTAAPGLYIRRQGAKVTKVLVK